MHHVWHRQGLGRHPLNKNGPAMEFRVAADGRSFFTEVDGYLCFLTPVMGGSSLLWRWYIQSGGGWTGRGGRDVHLHAEGVEISAQDAEGAMQAWIEAPQKPSLALVR